MPDIDWNRDTWDGEFNWTTQGEEWSAPWGDARAEWFSTLLPRIGGFLPAQRILEIAPGCGRWTSFLLEHCEEYVGIDLSWKGVGSCRRRFAGETRARFFRNDGQSLQAVADRRYDFIFSFDSLVHADLDAVGHYVPQAIQLLAPGGVAFIHHSNLAAFPGYAVAHRSENVSATIVAELVRMYEGRLLMQELLAWEGDLLSDCITVFSRENDYRDVEPVLVSDPAMLATEALYARSSYARYLSIRPRREGSGWQPGRI